MKSAGESRLVGLRRSDSSTWWPGLIWRCRGKRFDQREICLECVDRVEARSILSVDVLPKLVDDLWKHHHEYPAFALFFLL